MSGKNGGSFYLVNGSSQTHACCHVLPDPFQLRKHGMPFIEMQGGKIYAQIAEHFPSADPKDNLLF